MLTLAASLILTAGSVQTISAAFPICGNGPRVTCIVDGDTFWYEREKFRLVDIDAPEVSQPQCETEAAKASAATYRLAVLMDEAKLAIERRGVDRYGRTLALVSRGGQSVGERLVREGLARHWGDRRGWCVL